MRYILVLLILFASIGCSNKHSIYILPKPNAPVVRTTKVQIGVKKVKVPSSLNNNKIIAKNMLNAEVLDINFANSLDKLFTHQAITILKKALNNQNIFLYPWNVDSKKGYILSIVLDKIIYSDSQIILSGNYSIKRADDTMVNQNSFIHKIVSKKDPKDIVENLGLLFNKLVLEIAQTIVKI